MRVSTLIEKANENNGVKGDAEVYEAPKGADIKVAKPDVGPDDSVILSDNSAKNNVKNVNVSDDVLEEISGKTYEASGVLREVVYRVAGDNSRLYAASRSVLKGKKSTRNITPEVSDGFLDRIAKDVMCEKH